MSEAWTKSLILTYLLWRQDRACVKVKPLKGTKRARCPTG